MLKDHENNRAGTAESPNRPEGDGDAYLARATKHNTMYDNYLSTR